MTTFNTSIGAGYSPASGKAVPATHMNRAFNNTLALKQGDVGHDFLAGVQVDVTATGTQNDYSPGTGMIVRWNGASQVTITGLVAHLDGDMRILENVTAAQLLTLTHEGAGSTAANRLTLPGAASINVPPGGSIGLVYDGTSDRWRALFVHATEEAAWTPTLVSSGGGAPTYSAQVGKYSKVGRRVLVSGRVTLATIGTLAAGTLTIAGLPYAAENTTSLYSGIAVGYFFGMVTNVSSVTMFVQPNATSINIQQVTATQATGVVSTNKTDIGGTYDIIFGGSYPSGI